MTQILDGKGLSDLIKSEIKTKVEKRIAQGKKVPHLAAILVGEDPASETYVSNKIKSCAEVGFKSSLFRFEPSISEEELLEKVRGINEDDDIDGLIVQLPLPKHINVSRVIETTDYRKDVDGFHPISIGRMAKGLPGFLPATPQGILKILEHYRIETAGKHCVVVGRSQIVGSPISILMARDAYPGNATVTICHRHTKNIENFLRQADIIISAVGNPGFIKADMVKDGVVVIDVGTTRVEDPSKKSGFRLSGDVDFDSVAPKCSYITPVPKGVGPMTIVSLLLNTLQAVEMKS
jgi:methylenetetrahydrofolate dehydrogenase (NADP+)/methenyltetrahydrofolate cyclohydrolase